MAGIYYSTSNKITVLFSDWVTDDLFKKLEGRPDLLKKLSDPRYSQALNLFRTNPEEGLKLIQGNEELQSFIKDFCGILGEHFTLMAEKTVRNEKVAQY